MKKTLFIIAVLQVLLIRLKLADKIEVGWGVVFSPILIPVAVIVAVAGLLSYVAGRIKEENQIL